MTDDGGRITDSLEEQGFVRYFRGRGVPLRLASAAYRAFDEALRKPKPVTDAAIIPTARLLDDYGIDGWYGIDLDDIVDDILRRSDRRLISPTVTVTVVTVDDLVLSIGERSTPVEQESLLRPTEEPTGILSRLLRPVRSHLHLSDSSLLSPANLEEDN